MQHMRLNNFEQYAYSHDDQATSGTTGIRIRYLHCDTPSGRPHEEELSEIISAISRERFNSAVHRQTAVTAHFQVISYCRLL